MTLPSNSPPDSTNSTAATTAALRADLLAHPIYDAVRDLDALRLLMREHVFAVWDFMSLLKRMQQILTGTTLPWLPPSDPDAARFILEIVLAEEADEDGRGGHASHFDLYHQAMQELGADTGPIDRFLQQLHHGRDWDTALTDADILPTTREFVRFSLQTATHGSPPAVAAAFFFGREDIIPEMFARLVSTLSDQGTQVDRFRHYLNRHIELDGDHHGPLAAKLLASLCGNDPQRQTDADTTAAAAIRQRLNLWQGIYDTIITR